MARKVRTYETGDAMTEKELTPKSLTKQEFGKRLYDLMLRRGWTQSELARKVGIGRASISSYINGKSFPTPQTLRQMAETLGVTEEELLPNYVENAIDEAWPSTEIKVSQSRPELAWIRVNRLVKTSTALAIMELLSKDNASSDGNRSSDAA